MSRSLSSFIPSLFPLIPVALVAISVGCGSTVIGGGVEDEDGMSCGSVMGENGEVVKNPLCDVIEDDGIADGQDGFADDGSDFSDGNDDGSDGEPIEPEPTSIAMERDGLVLLQFASFGLTCGEESSALPECGGVEQYLLEVAMPASYLVAGVVDFADPAVTMFTQVAGSDDGGACSYFGGGSGFGSMQIHAVGAEVIDVTVNDAFMTTETQSGRFEVTRCAAGEEPPPVGTDAIGVRVSSVADTRESFTTTGGGGGPPPEDRLVIRIANHAQQTCANPYATPECPFEALAVAVSVPASLVQIGASIDLGRSDVFVSYSEQGGNEDGGDCWGTGGGSDTEVGTLNIEANGQGTLDVLFVNTNYDLLNGAHTVLLCD